MSTVALSMPASPTYRRAAARDGALGACIFAGLLGLRLLFAEEDFSYDYSAYIFYLDRLADYGFVDIFLRTLDRFPYVLIPGAPVFEFGFVLVAKAILTVVQDPTATYAIIAALSLGIRVYVMRQLGCSWLWITLVQIYAVTLFEANAIRVGLAATMVILGLYQILFDKRNWGWVFLFLSLCIHIQSVIFVAPFVAVWPIRKQIARSEAKLLMLVVLMCSMVLAVIATGLLSVGAKMGEYAAKESGSAGLNVTSVSAVGFALCALFLKVRGTAWNYDARLLWTSAMAAVVPSLVLFTTATHIAALGDRAWQFSFVVAASLVHTTWINKKKKRLPIRLLGAIALLSAVNVTLRYPLSNLFDFVLPHVYIQGWF